MVILFQKRLISTDDIEFDISSPVRASAANGENMIVVGGPAVNSQARALLDSMGESGPGVQPGQARVSYVASKNSILVYGWTKEGTETAARKVTSRDLSSEFFNE